MSWLRGKSRQFGAVLVGLLLVAGIGAFGADAAGDDGQRAGERSAKPAHVSRRARAASQRRAQRKVLRRAHVHRKRHLAKRAALSTSWGYGLGADPKFTLVGGTVSSRTSAQVNVANGNLVVSAKELTASPYDVQLPIVRWMNGLDPAVAAGSLGLGAQLSVGRDVSLETADLLGSEIFTGPSGAKALFPAQGLGFGSWHGGDLTLSRKLLGFEVAESGGAKYSFLLGLGTKLQSGYRDAAGKLADVDYDLLGTGASAWDSHWRRVRIDMPLFSARTSKVTAPDGSWAAYDYTGSPSRLSAVRYSNGTRVTITTTTAGRLASLVDPTGERLDVLYDSAGRTTKITIIAGSSVKIWQYAYGTGAPCTQTGEVSWTKVTLPDGSYKTYCAGSDLIVRRVIDPAPPADTVAPALTLGGDLVTLAGAWTKNDSGTVSLAATDAGSGVTKLELKNGTTTLGTQTQTCAAGGCSMSQVFPVDLSSLGEGTKTLTATATDANANVATGTLTVRVDRGPPVLNLSGSLVDQQQTTGSSGSRAVHAVASDDASGVVLLTLAVDGIETERAEQSCAAGGCPLTADWTVDLASLSDGTHDLTVTATDQAGRTTTQHLTARTDRYQMPSAPPLSQTEVTPYVDQVSWLWSGSNPLQTGVAPGTITAKRAAVITGSVFNGDGDPAGGVTVTVVDHPEFGSTKSRSNGKYFLGVNGGQEYRLHFEVQGAVSADREVATKWDDYALAPDVWMVALDAKGTNVAFGAAATTLQEASATPVTDQDGSRTTRLLVRPGTLAWTQHTDGSLTSLPAGTIRMTEFTVGAKGPERMPSALPNTTDYTWAADFRVDQASGPGDAHVRFSKPLVVYTDNFLEQPVGLDIPQATYDQASGVWEGEPDGRVVKILDVNAAGDAILDVTGFGAANAAELEQFNIDQEELHWLGQTYPVGKSLWRSESVRFSVDGNHPRVRKKHPKPKGKPKPGDPKPCDTKPGSIIGCQAQSLGEVADLGGTPYSLRYESTRTPGATGTRSVVVPLTNDTVDSDLNSVQVDVLIAGQRLSYVDETPTPNEFHTFRWNGKDAFDRPMIGGAMADVSVHELYSGGAYAEGKMLGGAADKDSEWEWVVDPFLTSSGATVSWGRPSGGDYVTRVMAGVKPAYQPTDRPNLECTSDESQCWYPVTDKTAQWKLSATRALEDNAFNYSVPVAYADARSFGVGGWTISDLHRYDAATGTLFGGDGSKRAASDLPDIVKTVRTVSGTDNPVELRQTDGVDIAVLPDGSTLRSDAYFHRILKDDPSGHTTVFAGNATRVGSDGDGGPATDASLTTPQQLAVAPDGSVYVTDIGAAVVRKIDSSGVISTVAGNGTNGGTYTNGPNPQDPLQRNLIQPEGLGVAPDGTVYIGDRSGLYMLSPDGTMMQLGSSYNPYCGNPKLAECLFYSPPTRYIAVAPDGTVYWSGSNASVNRTLRWTPGDDEAQLLVAADTNVEPHEAPIGDSNVAARGLEVDPQGQLWIVADKNNESSVWKLGTDGRVTQIGLASCRDRDESYRYTGEGGPFKAACGQTFAMANGPDGMYLLEDANNIQIRKVVRALPQYPTGSSLIPSGDGSEAYQFNAAGRQTATLDGLTGRITRTFSYDGQGRITAINETDYGTTTFAYDTSGNATVTGPDHQQTQLDANVDGYATKVTDATGAAQHYAYTADGLLTQKTNELGDATTFSWSPTGRLLADTTPLGQTQTLSRVDDGRGSTVTHADSAGATTTYAIADDGGGAPVSMTTNPDGTQASVTIDRRAGTSSRSLPDGTTVTTRQSGDARWGANAPGGAVDVTLPSGRSAHAERSSSVTRNDAQNPNDPFDFASTTDVFTMSGATSAQADRRSWTSTYTAADRATTAKTPLGRSVTAQFDDHDRPTRVTTAGRNDTTISYDARGRVTAVAQGGAQATASYGADGYVARTVDEEGRVTSADRDALGRPVAITAPDGTITRLAWDAASQLTAITAPDGRRFTSTYDRDGRMVRSTAQALASAGGPDRSSGLIYDAAGRLTGVTRPSGKSIAFAYDDADRVTKVSAGDGTSMSTEFESVTGGRGGRLAALSTGEGARTTFGYDGGLPTRVVETSDTAPGDATGDQPAVTFDYDAALRPTTLTIAGESVVYGYNADNQVTSAGPISLGHDSATGDLQSLTAATSATAWQIDSQGQVSSQVHTSENGQNVVLSESMTRDRLGRITQRTQTDDTGTHLYGYGYDLAGRLTQVTRDGGTVESYGYNASGALISRGAGLLSGSFALDGHGYPATTPDGSAVTWSPDGEETSIETAAHSHTAFSYDGFGRLTGVSLPDGTTGAYRYDALGRRTEVRLGGSLVRRYVYGESLWPQARVDANGDVIERYVYAIASQVPDLIVRRDGQRLRLVTDATHSVRAVVDVDTGQTLERIDYDAYGRVTRDTNPGLQPFGFKGALTDPVAEGAGLVWMGVRAYQPALARFTTAEPAGVAVAWNAPDAFQGDPINLVDAAGTWPSLQDVSNTAAGFGDGIAGAFGAASCALPGGCSPSDGWNHAQAVMDQARADFGNLYGFTSDVDKCSAAYNAAQAAGAAATVATGAVAVVGALAGAARGSGAGKPGGVSSGADARNAIDNLPRGRQPDNRVVNSAGDIEDLYGQLSKNGTPNTPPRYGGASGGESVRLPDGTTIGKRNDSGSGGPAIDIRIPGEPPIKVHVK